MTKRLLVATALMACLPEFGAAEGLTKPVLGYQAAERVPRPSLVADRRGAKSTCVRN